MADTTLILLAAGSSSRFEHNVKKQWLRIGHTPLWQFVAQNFAKTGFFSKIIITASATDIEFMKLYSSEFLFVEGGATRQLSLKNALNFVESEYVLVSDIARACIETNFLQTILSHKEKAPSIVPYLNVTDTIVYQNQTINRDDVKRVQTPQLSHTQTLKEALQTSQEFTDESSAIVALGKERYFVLGDEAAHKITYVHDLNKIPCLTPPSNDTLSGNGFDVHPFEPNKPMYLGGVHIEDVEYGFAAHSDGDVAIHALIDALLGAAGFGDIGMLFPDNDNTYKNIDSKKLLSDVVTKLHNYGFEIINVDVTIAAQKPRLANYKLKMRTTLAEILEIDQARCNIKATTTEKLGFVGRSEGVAVWANANLKYFDWTKVEN